MNGEQLDNALRHAYDRLSESARDFQDLCDSISKLADSEFAKSDRNKFVTLHRALKTEWDFMCVMSDEIDQLEVETPEDNPK